MLTVHLIAQSGGTGPSFNSAQGSPNSAMFQIDFTRIGALSKSRMKDYEEILKEYKGIEGSPFLEGREILVDIYDDEDRYAPNVIIKYDVFNNEILAKQANTEQIILDLDYYSKIIGKGSDVGLVLKKLDPETPDRFYIELFSSKDVTFFKDVEVQLTNHQSHMPGVDSKDSFFKKESYFVKVDSKIYPINLRSNQPFAEIPKWRRTNLKSEAKKYDLKKVKKEQDYIKYFERKFKETELRRL